MPVFILLFLLWILLSGGVSLKVFLSGALISVLLCLFSSKTLGYDFHYISGAHKKILDKLRYLVFLWWEILKAGYQVMKMVYTKGSETSPVLVCFHTGLKSDKEKTILANSITLTAGTITVQAEDDLFCVHALDRSLADGIENCEFERRISKLGL